MAIAALPPEPPPAAISPAVSAYDAPETELTPESLSTDLTQNRIEVSSSFQGGQGHSLWGGVSA